MIDVPFPVWAREWRQRNGAFSEVVSSLLSDIFRSRLGKDCVVDAIAEESSLVGSQENARCPLYSQLAVPHRDIASRISTLNSTSV